MSTRPPGDAAGFTLIELMVSLGLFALIAVAGLALVDGILNVQQRTEARLDRVADLQRGLFVVASDLEQIAGGDLTGNAAGIAFQRAAPGMGGVAVPVRYATAGGALVRSVGAAPQPVLTGVSGAQWRYWDNGWSDHWPRDEAGKHRWPRAVAVEMRVALGSGGAGTLRRVVTLPVRAEEPRP